ncbi:hypothetical protein ACTZWW_08465 [Salinarimonas sp. NSM]|uniref:hypothetical protein n=1 Tax=Salinarimonas sp. NSM TaxID=3458003 RepID=UPI004036B887
MSKPIKPHPSILVQPPGSASRYNLTPEDRILFEGREWSWLQTTEIGQVLLAKSDGPNAVAETFTHEEFHRHLQEGQLQVDRGWYSPHCAVARARYDEQIVAALDPAQLKRLFFREAWARIFLDFERDGRVKRTEASIKAAIPQMLIQIFLDRSEERAGDKRKDARRTFTMNGAPCAKSILTWAVSYGFGGLAALQDDCMKSGNRSARMLPDAISLLHKVVRKYADPSRPTKAAIVQEVKDTFAAENIARAQAGLFELRVPGKDAVFGAIKQLDPFETDVRRLGIEKALKKHAAVGAGLVVELPLERVEMDEWKMDVLGFLAKAGIVEKLSPEMREAIRVGRWLLTIAIDCATRCIVALRISQVASADSAIAALEMITLDKKQWADAVGALSHWFMHGTPVQIATDNNRASFKSKRFRLAANAIGSHLVRPPAGVPQLRGTIERVFGTIAIKLMWRLTGRTFANIFERGDHDPEANVAHDVDTLIVAVVRWIVDIYHNTPRAELGGETPIQAWRRLERTKGAPPPPSLLKRRLAFGSVLKRPVTNRGIRVLGVDYTSPELMYVFRHTQQREFEVRWLASDIGGILVRLPGGFVEVPATHADVFRGVDAPRWLAAGRDMRSRLKANEAAEAETIRKALAAIDEVDRFARGRAGIVAEDWSSERIAREEARTFGAFRMGEPKARSVETGPRDLLANVVSAGGDTAQAPADDNSAPVAPAPLEGAAPAPRRKRAKGGDAPTVETPDTPADPTELE